MALVVETKFLNELIFDHLKPCALWSIKQSSILGLIISTIPFECYSKVPLSYSDNLLIELFSGVVEATIILSDKVINTSLVFNFTLIFIFFDNLLLAIIFARNSDFKLIINLNYRCFDNLINFI